MNTIVLILTLAGNMSSGTAIKEIEGFSTIKACEKAGKKWKDKQTTRHSSNFVCI
jgi:hypothetical protein